MEEPQKIKSPLTGALKCFVEKYDGVTSYLCLDSGYTSNSNYEIDSELIKKVEKGAPKIVNDLRFVDDERNIIWYPSVLQIPGTGMIFPDGTDKDDWGWSVAKEIKLEGEDQYKFPIPDKDGEYYTSMLDMENIRTFQKKDFEMACETLGIIKEV
jgi:hypothetical protein